jgi:hypothetical protein
MIYTFKIYMLVAAVVFGFAGTFLVALAALNEAKKYARALQAMRRIAGIAPRERFVISRTTSRNPNSDSVRAA